jgi:glycosyltransferase involved in cell wall biosynthesis
MKVSILLLSYNQVDFIAKAIEGVVCQKTTFPFELLISDDCSTDGTREIIEQYHVKYPNIVVPYFQQVNLGPKNNDYFLFQQSKGDYICYCEADDFWCDEEKLQKQVTFLDANPDFGLVHGDVNFFYVESQEHIRSYNSTNRIQIDSGDVYEKVMIGNHYIKTMTVCYRKSLLLQHYFTDDYIMQSNWMMVDLSQWLCLASCSKIQYMDDVMATYCLRTESMSRSRSAVKMHQFHMDVFDIRFHFIKKYGCLPETANTVNKMFVKTLIGDAYKLNSRVLLNKAIKFAQEKGIEFRFKDRLKIVFISAMTLIQSSRYHS